MSIFLLSTLHQNKELLSTDSLRSNSSLDVVVVKDALDILDDLVDLFLGGDLAVKGGKEVRFGKLMEIIVKKKKQKKKKSKKKAKKKSKKKKKQKKSKKKKCEKKSAKNPY